MLNTEDTENNSCPQGFTWNADTYSCAYDSLFSILFNLFKQNKANWQTNVCTQNELLYKFTTMFKQVMKNKLTMEEARDKMRCELHKVKPEVFPVEGKDGANIYELCATMLSMKKDYIFKTYICLHYTMEFESETDNPVLWDCTKPIWKDCVRKMGSCKNHKISEWLLPLFICKTQVSCPNCEKTLVQQYKITKMPNFMMFITNGQKIHFDQSIELGDPKLS